MKFSSFSTALALAGLLTLAVFAPTQAGDFVHPSDIVAKIKANFKNLKTYQADFKITTTENKKQKQSRGHSYYKAGGKLNFTFTQPEGDQIISDGKRIWIYIASLNAVGVQDLNAKSQGKNLYDTASYEGLVSLFKLYHYSFDTPNQPRKVDNENMYVFKLQEKVASGGFDQMLLYVSADTFLIRKVEASSPSGRQVSLVFSNILLDKDIPGNLFSYEVKGSVRVVENPLTAD